MVTIENVADNLRSVTSYEFGFYYGDDTSSARIITELTRDQPLPLFPGEVRKFLVRDGGALKVSNIEDLGFQVLWQGQKASLLDVKLISCLSPAEAESLIKYNLEGAGPDALPPLGFTEC